MLFPLSYRMHQTLLRVAGPSASRSGHDADLGASGWESSISVEALSLRNRSKIRAGILYGWAVVYESKAFAIDVLAVVECEPGCLTHEFQSSRRARCWPTLITMLRICLAISALHLTSSQPTPAISAPKKPISNA